jgi:hypothetical protein
MTKIILILSLAFVMLLGGTLLTMYIQYNNSEIILRQKVNGQISKTQASFDNCWKVLKSKAGVTDQYKNAFKDIYPALIEGRYSKGDGSLMKWIQESNPTFDISLYKDLMRSIEVERATFINEQEVLIDMNVQHDIMINTMPSKWFISNVEPIKIVIIKSARTNDAYATGEENDFELFDKPKTIVDTIKK